MTGTRRLARVAGLLYQLLRHVNRPVAAAMVTFVAVSVAIMCLNSLSQLAALLLATGTDTRAPSARPGRTPWCCCSPTSGTTGS